MRNRRFVGMGLMCLIVFLPVSARAGSDQEELLKKIEVLEQQLKDLKELQKASVENESHCVKAVGKEKFCTCIAEKLPRGVSFEQYVHTVVTPKETLGYEAMNPEQKKIVDGTLAARDACVKEKGGFLW